MNLLQQVPIRLVGRVVLQDIENETFLDGLPHSVQAERPIRAVGIPVVPNNSKVLGLGVAVKANELTFRSCPRFFISATIRSSRSSSSSLSAFSASSRLSVVSTDLRLLVLSPVCDEWASSMMTANRFPGRSPISPSNDWKLLQRRHDDGFAVFQRLLQLMGRGVDVLHDAGCLLKGQHVSLQLAIQHLAVGNHDDGIEDPLLIGIVECREVMGQPGNRIALATARTVLNQISLPGAMLPGMVNQPTNTCPTGESGERAISACPSSCHPHLPRPQPE